MIGRFLWSAAAVLVATVAFYGLAHVLAGAGAERFQAERATVAARALAFSAAEAQRASDPERMQAAVTALIDALPAVEEALVLRRMKILAHTDPARAGARLASEDEADKALFDQELAMRADVRKNEDEREENPLLGRDAYPEAKVEALPGGRFSARVPVKVDGAFSAMAQVTLKSEPVPTPFPVVLGLIGLLAALVMLPVARLRGPALLAAGGSVLATALVLETLQLRGWQASVLDDRAERHGQLAARLAAAGLAALAPEDRDPAGEDPADRDPADPSVRAPSDDFAAALSLDALGVATGRIASVRSTTVAGAAPPAPTEATDGPFAVALGERWRVLVEAEHLAVIEQWAVGISVLAALVFVLGIFGAFDRAGRALYTHRSAYGYLSPAMLGLVILVFIPVVVGITLGFHSRIYNEYHWVGLTNYIRILSDFDLSNPRSFWFTLSVTVLWTVSNVLLHVSLGLFLALLLNDQMLKAKGIYRVILVVPWAIPNYVTALIWKSMFHKQFGAVNAALEALGFEGIAWFQTFWPAFSTNVVTNTWLGFPFMMVVSLGALQSIPPDLYEAARVDGASRWQRFSRITLPLLMPALVPAVIVGTVWTFNMFNIIYLVSGGAPNGATDILITEAYRWAFEMDDKGFAAAYSTVIFLILLTFTLVTNRITGATKGAFE